MTVDRKLTRESIRLRRSVAAFHFQDVTVQRVDPFEAIRPTFLTREVIDRRVGPLETKSGRLFYPAKWQSKESFHLRRRQADIPPWEVTVQWVDSSEARSGRLSYPEKWRSKEWIRLGRGQADFPSERSDGPKSGSIWGEVCPTLLPREMTVRWADPHKARSGRLSFSRKRRTKVSIHLWRVQADTPTWGSDGQKSGSIWGEVRPTFLYGKRLSKESIHLRWSQADFPYREVTIQRVDPSRARSGRLSYTGKWRLKEWINLRLGQADFSVR